MKRSSPLLITSEVTVLAFPARRDRLRRVVMRGVALLAAASLAACANPTGPTDLNTPTHTTGVTNSSSAAADGGVGAGSSG